MKIIKTIAEIKAEMKKHRFRGRSIGFVPTMGYLHNGHLSLVEQCRKENDINVVSIFVNPTQFAPGEDFEAYPRDFKMDEKALREMGTDILFLPEGEGIYPHGYLTYVEVDKLGKVLCGKTRSTHFRGVTTVVLKLFNIVNPDNAYFGRKDAQQAVIIKKMVQDLDIDVTIRALPIIRDADGLALSSRNTYLSRDEREAALTLSLGLRKAEQRVAGGLRNAAGIKEVIQKELETSELIKIDYIEVVSLTTLEPFDAVSKEAEIDMNHTLIAAAIWVGKTRLIDNFILGEI